MKKMVGSLTNNQQSIRQRAPLQNNRRPPNNTRPRDHLTLWQKLKATRPDGTPSRVAPDEIPPFEHDHDAFYYRKDLGKTPIASYMEFFNEYNRTIGNALGELGEQPQRVRGRDQEIGMLYSILERPKTPVAILLGKAGVGKTALVEELGRQLNSGEIKTSLEYKYLLVSLRLGSLSSIGTHKLQAALANITQNLLWFEKLAQKVLRDDTIRIVLFIDEVHMVVTIFGPGTKVGGDVMKDVLARSPIRIITATTRKEYDSTIAVDEPFAERFKQIEMQELSANIVEDILVSWWGSIEKNIPCPSRDLLAYVIKANAMYRSDHAEPRKSLDIMEDFVSLARRENRRIVEQDVHDLFKRRYEINLSFNIDPDKIWYNVKDQVKGQPYAISTIKQAIRSMVFQLDPVSTKPQLTMLMTGPTGVGKTQTVKAITEALYPDNPNVLLNINMPDYKRPDLEPSFRKRVGEYIRHTPSAVILLDEFEKAGETVMDSMLTILDEGLITFEVENREGQIEPTTVSLRNTIVVATTNAGANVFSNERKFAQDSVYAEDDPRRADVLKSGDASLITSIKNELKQSNFKPEMLGRFQHIIPYRGLNEKTFAMIAEAEITKLFDQFYAMRDIKIEHKAPKKWPEDRFNLDGAEFTDLAIYIAFVLGKADDTNAGGARSIKNAVQSSIYTGLVDAIIDNPDKKRFSVEVSDDSYIYDHTAVRTTGGVIVRAID